MDDTANKESEEIDDDAPQHGKAGRPKGAQNKLTRTVREAILAALDAAGGVDYLAAVAREEPVAFLNLLGKMLPNKVEHAGADGKDLAPAVAIFALPDNGRDR